jgi:hypothetical protein
MSSIRRLNKTTRLAEIRLTSGAQRLTQLSGRQLLSSPASARERFNSQRGLASDLRLFALWIGLSQALKLDDLS